MSSERDQLLEGVSETYGASLAEHGPVPRGVGWKSEDEQRLRFEQLLRAVEPAGAVTVNDLGCGYGALFGFLDERLGDRLAAYHGYDISGEMLAAAAERVDDPRARFEAASSPTHEADYSFASGLFNVRLDAADDDWEAHVHDTLRALYASSRRAIAFNVPTTHVDWRDPKLYYGDPVRYFAWCRDQLSPRVALLHDYPLFEWTMIVRRA